MTEKRKPGRPPKVELPETPPDYGETFKPSAPLIGPIALSVREVIEITALCRSSVYRDIKSGKLPAKKSGVRTIVLMRDLQDYIAALPSAS